MTFSFHKKRVVTFFALLGLLFAIFSLATAPAVVIDIEPSVPLPLNVFYYNGEESGYPFDAEHVTPLYALQDRRQQVEITLRERDMKSLRIDFGDDPASVTIYGLDLKPSPFRHYHLTGSDVLNTFVIQNGIASFSQDGDSVTYVTTGDDGHIATVEDIFYSRTPTMSTKNVLSLLAGILLVLLIAFTNILNALCRLGRSCIKWVYVRLRSTSWGGRLRHLSAEKHPFVISCLLTTAILIFMLGWTIAKGKTLIYLDIGADTYAIIWPNYARFRNQILGNIGRDWSFAFGLGGNVNMSSLMRPSTFLIALFPPEKMYIGFFLAAIFRAYMAHAYSFLYFRELGQKGLPLVAASLCCTFSGYFWGWGQHSFGSVYVIFLAVMYGFERYLKRKQWIWFVAALAYLAVVSPYFTYKVLLFMMVYATFRYFMYNRNILGYILYGLKLLGYVVLALALVMFSFWPSVESILNSGRVTGAAASVVQLKFQSAKGVLVAFSRFLSNSLIGINAVYSDFNFYETAFYYVGIFLVVCIAVLLLDKEQRHKTTIRVASLLILFSIVFPVPFNLAFDALSAQTTRWTLVLVPVFSLAVGCGYAYLAERKPDRTMSVGIVLAIVAAGGVCIAMLYAATQITMSSAAKKSASFVLFVLLLYLLLSLLDGGKYHWKKYALLGVLCLELAVTAEISVNMRSNIGISAISQLDYFDHTAKAIDACREQDDSFFRVNKTYAKIDLNDSMIQNYYGEKLYSTTIPSDMFTFLSKYMTLGRLTHYIWGFDNQPELRNFLSVKYTLSKQLEKLDGWTLVGQVDDIYIYQNDNVLPLGYVYHQSLTEGQNDSLSMEQRIDALYSAVVVAHPGQLPQYRLPPDQPVNKQEKIEALRNDALEISHFEEDYILGHISLKQPGVLFFSIPYDEGWIAKVDGRPVEVERVNYAFCGFAVDVGEHDIELNYDGHGSSVGYVISLGALILPLVGTFINKRRRMKNPHAI